MVQVARGKALVAKLRAQPGVRNPEALAAYLGRFKKARQAGASVAAAAKAAKGGGGDKKGAGALADRVRAGSRPEAERRENAKARERNRWEWVRHFDRMAESHARISQDYQRRAEELCEEGAL